MTIKTYYYRVGFGSQSTVENYRVPVLVRGKQLMPIEVTVATPFGDNDKVLKKTDYTLRWLDKYDKSPDLGDPNYQKGQDILIDFYSADKTLQTFLLHLNLWQRFKMNIIWKRYWLIKDGNFKTYILPIIIGVISTLLATLIKDYRIEKEPDNSTHQTVTKDKN